ncbi:unnamed protein product [Symbiodinium necroappetens]|uniref:Uncharacterized protein n=1 Tax=Symbiodinium necroappetens TaxID=1628268 RepID=A0A812YUZ4_9DINO|nr:unnamed protein product [Symbiodinium necroappetens]
MKVFEKLDEESYTPIDLLSFSRQYKRKAVDRGTKAEVAERLLQVMKKNPGKDRPKQRKADKEDEGSDANSFGEKRCVAWEPPQQAGSGNHEVYEIPDDGVDDDDLTILLDVPQDAPDAKVADADVMAIEPSDEDMALQNEDMLAIVLGRPCRDQCCFNSLGCIVSIDDLPGGASEGILDYRLKRRKMIGCAPARAATERLLQSLPTTLSVGGYQYQALSQAAAVKYGCAYVCSERPSWKTASHNTGAVDDWFGCLKGGVAVGDLAVSPDAVKELPVRCPSIVTEKRGDATRRGTALCAGILGKCGKKRTAGIDEPMPGPSSGINQMMPGAGLLTPRSLTEPTGSSYFPDQLRHGSVAARAHTDGYHIEPSDHILGRESETQPIVVPDVPVCMPNFRRHTDTDQAFRRQMTAPCQHVPQNVFDWTQEPRSGVPIGQELQLPDEGEQVSDRREGPLPKLLSSGDDLAVQRRINKALTSAARSKKAECINMVLRVAAANLHLMNGVNVATAIHRLARICDGSQRNIDQVAQDEVFQLMLEIAECKAQQEFQLQDSSMPSSCCTIIIWSCAVLRFFVPSLMAVLARVASRSLADCQSYEVTNMLWGFAELCKREPVKAAGMRGSIEELVDAAACVMMPRRAASWKVQVLISAFVSLAAFPCASQITTRRLVVSIIQELAQRSAELVFHDILGIISMRSTSFLAQVVSSGTVMNHSASEVPDGRVDVSISSRGSMDELVAVFGSFPATYPWLRTQFAAGRAAGKRSTPLWGEAKWRIAMQLRRGDRPNMCPLGVAPTPKPPVDPTVLFQQSLMDKSGPVSGPDVQEFEFASSAETDEGRMWDFFHMLAKLSPPVIVQELCIDTAWQHRINAKGAEGTEYVTSVRISPDGPALNWWLTDDGRIRIDGTASVVEVFKPRLRALLPKYAKGQTSQHEFTGKAGKACKLRMGQFSCEATARQERQERIRGQILMLPEEVVFCPHGKQGVWDVLESAVGVRNVPENKAIPRPLFLRNGAMVQIWASGRIKATDSTADISCLDEVERVLMQDMGVRRVPDPSVFQGNRPLSFGYGLKAPAPETAALSLRFFIRRLRTGSFPEAVQG